MEALTWREELMGDGMLIPGKRIAVLGLGKSGFAAARLLRRIGCFPMVSDSRPVSSLDREMLHILAGERIFTEAGGHEKETILGADGIVVSPGVPTEIPLLMEAKKRRIPLIGEMELASRYCKTPLIAITGTNGKSTVTTLVGEILGAAGKKTFVGGNLGTPLSEYVMGPQDADYAVCEVSSFQLDTAPTMRPRIAVLLNISPDHLDRYASFDQYGASKMSVFANQLGEDVAVLNMDDPEIRRRLHMLPPCTRWFYSAEGRDDCHGIMRDGGAMLRGGEGRAAEVYSLGHTALAMPPNGENALAAILACRSAGCPPDAIRKGLDAYAVLPHRMTFVRKWRGVTYIDDSKATNVGAAAAALGGINTPVVLIAGGRDKGGDYDMLFPMMRQKVRVLLLIGEARERMAAAFEGLTRIECCGSMEEAVAKAAGLAVFGDTVLLSPACASFDMFSGYAERGRVFQDAARNLP